MQTSRNFQPPKGKTFCLVSKTNPSFGLSVANIIDRAKRGLPIHGNNYHLFDEGNPVPDFDSMDFTDKDQYMRELAALKPQTRKDGQQEENRRDPQPPQDTPPNTEPAPPAEPV